KKSTSCFESLMLRQAQQNGIFSIISKPPPFVLSSSKDSEGVFQQPAGLPKDFGYGRQSMIQFIHQEDFSI
ncbi:MAG TPA: hypothetical protein VGB27_16770, partial [Candidatus Binatia bacterium]